MELLRHLDYLQILFALRKWGGCVLVKFKRD